MAQTGRLTISNGESRLDGTLLARKGAPDPLGAATNFLGNLGLNDGDRITVTGGNGSIGGASVIFIESAAKADEGVALAAAMETTAAVTATPRRSPRRTKPEAVVAKKKTTKRKTAGASIKRRKTTATARGRKLTKQRRQRRGK
jgi:hypothetical protein